MEKDKMILCDTDVIIEFYKNNPAIISDLKKIGQEKIAISTITAGELIYGALNKKELNRIKKDIDNLNVIDIDKNICEVFLEVMSKYSLSHNLTLPDGFIASSALAHDLELFTLNLRDFQFIDKLKLYRR